MENTSIDNVTAFISKGITCYKARLEALKLIFSWKSIKRGAIYLIIVINILETFEVNPRLTI